MCSIFCSVCYEKRLVRLVIVQVFRTVLINSTILSSHIRASFLHVPFVRRVWFLQISVGNAVGFLLSGKRDSGSARRAWPAHRGGSGASTNIAVFPQSREHRSHEDHGVIQYIGMHGLCLHVSLRVCL